MKKVLVDWRGTRSLNTLDSPQRLQEDESPMMINAEIRRFGTVAKREGYRLIANTAGTATNPIVGLKKYKKMNGTGAGEYLCIFQNGHLYTKLKGSDTLTDQGAYTTTDVTAKVSAVVFLDTLVFCDGYSTTLWKWDAVTAPSAVASSPNASFLIVGNQTLIASGEIASPSKVYWSNVDSFTNWTTGVAGSINVSHDDGEKVTGLSMHQDKIICFKESAKYVLTIAYDTNGLPTGYRQQDTYEKSDGAISHHSISPDYGVTLHFGKRGLQSYGTQLNYPDRQTTQNLSKKIIDITRNYNRDKSEQACSKIFNDQYYLSFASNASWNNTFLLYNLQDRMYGWTLWHPIEANCFEIFGDGQGDDELYFGSSTSNALYKFPKEITFIDREGSTERAIEFYYRSPTYVIAVKPDEQVHGYDAFVSGYITSPHESTVRFVVDGGKQSQEFTIDDNDIVDPSIPYVIGQGIFGQSYFGGIVPSFFKRFYKKINLGLNMRDFKEIYFEIENTKSNQGIMFDRLVLEGKIVQTS